MTSQTTVLKRKISFSTLQTHRDINQYLHPISNEVRTGKVGTGITSTILFQPEDEISMFLLKVGIHLQDYTVSQPPKTRLWTIAILKTPELDTILCGSTRHGESPCTNIPRQPTSLCKLLELQFLYHNEFFFFVFYWLCIRNKRGFPMAVQSTPI
jgi:hypothetical protein